MRKKMTQMPIPKDWPVIVGSCRNDQDKVVAHLYTGPSFCEPRYPLCQRGWNRSNGHSFSILRGTPSAAGTCKACLRAKANGTCVDIPTGHKTKWM
jgi:hypothetical protein